MKIYETEHKGIAYRFEMFESVDKVEILKADVHEYSILKSRRSWKCTCWGSTRWGYCWHMQEALPMLMLTPSCSEPWCEWAEEAMVMNQQNNPNAATVR
ncbi:MAG: hypothetical protein KKC55_16095 [Gammaproteobacteria bacterium]|nr:hypothetical protein [Gammaproteobacteria bacterium]